MWQPLLILLCPCSIELLRVWYVNQMQYCVYMYRHSKRLMFRCYPVANNLLSLGIRIKRVIIPNFAHPCPFLVFLCFFCVSLQFNSKTSWLVLKLLKNAWPSDLEHLNSPLDKMLVHRSVTPSIKFASTHLYTWVEKGTVGVKCFAQEHNTMSSVRARTRTARSGVQRTYHALDHCASHVKANPLHRARYVQVF